MSYTTSELEASIAKLLRSEIRREYGPLGNRRGDLTYSDVRDAAAGVFLLFEGAPFYVVKLACDRLKKELETEKSVIDNLIAAISSTGRRVTAVENISALANARVALSSLVEASDSRSTTFEAIEEVPAYERFNSNTQRFLDEQRNNVVEDGSIVMTPEEGRKSLASLFRQLKTLHVDVLRRVGLLRSAIEDFNALELPAKLARSIYDNSRSVLEEHITQLESLSPADRLGILRNVVLDVLATRAAVKGFSSLSSPTTFHQLTGLGSVFADDDHPAAPAVLSSDIYGPYALLNAPGSGLFLDFYLDGDLTLTTTVQLLGSFISKIEGVIRGPYDVGDPNGNGQKTDLIAVGLKNWSAVGAVDLVTVALTTNAAAESFDIAGDINTAIPLAIPNLPLFAEPYANPLRFSGPVDIDVTPAFGSDADIKALGGTADFSALGVEVGDWVRVSDPTSSNFALGGPLAFGAIFEVENINTTTTPNDTLGVAQLTSHVLVDEQGSSGGKLIEIGGGKMPMRLRISARATEPGGDYRLQAVLDRVAVVFPQDKTTGTPVPKDTQYDGITNLGFYPLQEAPSRPVPATELAEAVRQSFAAQVGQEVRLSAQAVFSATLYSGGGRTDPNNFLRAILSKQRDFDATITSLGGSLARFTLSQDVGASVTPGDVVVIRTHTTPAQIGNWGTITLVNGDEIEASMQAPVVADVGREVELGPDMRSSITPLEPTLVVSGGTVNDGVYGIRNVKADAIPIELDLDRPFAFPAGAGNLPVSFTAELGQYRVDFSSTNTSLETAITIDSVSSPNAIFQFFVSVPVSAVGQTSYFQLPSTPKALGEGDMLELYPDQFNDPDVVLSVVGIEPSLNVIELDGQLPTNTATYNFSQDTPVPFARIRKRRLDNYSVFKVLLDDWLELDTAQDQYFIELQRLLNPLTVNSNPTLSQINDPVVHATALATDVDALVSHLDSYAADVVEQVDTLIDAFTQKGADRAVKLLLEARFSDFFGLDVDELSYSGTLQKTIRETERNDLPIRKTDRRNQNVAQDTLIASYEEPDFEFDRSDAEAFEDVAIPGNPGGPYPGASF